jgi:hypothetical protein
LKKSIKDDMIYFVYIWKLDNWRYNAEIKEKFPDE